MLASDDTEILEEPQYFAYDDEKSQLVTFRRVREEEKSYNADRRKHSSPTLFQISTSEMGLRGYSTGYAAQNFSEEGNFFEDSSKKLIFNQLNEASDGFEDKPNTVKSDLPLILCVDDEPMNIYVIKEMLKERNLDSISATSGREAIDIIQERIENFLLGQDSIFKIILLDYSMPEMDGPAVAREIVKMFSIDSLRC